MSFVNAHFIAYITDLGYSRLIAAGSFSLIGGCAIVGALVLGHLSDKHGRRSYLSFSYALRCVGFVLVLFSMGIPFFGIPSMGLATLITGIVLVGLSWNAVVALTAAFASDKFGLKHLGTIYGPCSQSCHWGPAWAPQWAAIYSTLGAPTTLRSGLTWFCW